jgi:hypothetical protein
MGNTVTDLKLGPGVRCIIGKRFRNELTAKKLSEETLTKSSGAGASPAVQTVCATLKATEASAATAVFFYFLTAITLGIYLLWVLYLVRYISQDSSGFYSLALGAMKQLSSEPRGDLVNKDPLATERKMLEVGLPILDENPLKTSCDEIFDKFSGQVSLDYVSYEAESAYDIFRELARKDWHGDWRLNAVSALRIDRADAVGDALIALFGDLAIYVSGSGLPSLREGVSVEQWNAFLGRLIQFGNMSSVHKEYKTKVREKIDLVENALVSTFESPAFAGMVAEKVRPEFQIALVLASKNSPLSKFFSLPQTSNLDKLIFFAVRATISEGLGKGECRCPESFAISRFSAADANSDAIVGALLFKATGENFDETSEEDKTAVIDAVNQLLFTLEGAIRKELATVSFEFPLKSGDAKQMTLSEFCTAKVEEWMSTNPDPDDPDSVTNGQGLEKAREAAERAAEKFSGEIDGVAYVREYREAAGLPGELFFVPKVVSSSSDDSSDGGQ